MGLLSSLAVLGGAGLGALLRWVLGMTLNPIFPTIPLGTLSANLTGGFLMGVAVEAFATHANAPPELRLALTTGFLGGFTTFSTFSAEAVHLISRRLYGWSFALVGIHVIGCLFPTAIGREAARLVLWRR
ncbi:MAG TPA: fluoride efflux transporter CrcB [Burkholderiaceae bacterium]|nr:fluoride efflux transporter CrcB [Burkholderiaceae bacterium]